MTTSPRPTSRQDGVALILVLAMLVLMSGLLVAFVTSAGTENTAAKTYAQGMEARQAAESAVNLVIAQIRQATEGDGEKGTWASQPGAIRTFGNAGKGDVFKLYSAEVMKEASTTYKPELDAGIDSGNPTKLPTGYVDINEPVLVPIPGDASDRAEPRFPIVSPYGAYAWDGSKLNTGSKPSAGKEAVLGFSCNAVNDPSGRKDVDNQTIKVLPMPVRWLYILKDGMISSVDSQGKIKDATVANPVVARTAFWTDDDCSRLNVNTASEGTYWDTPIVSSYQDSGNINGWTPVAGTYLNFSVAQPAKAEYQRFPGHPATTCLSPVLRWMFNEKPFGPPKVNDQDVLFKEAIYRMAPRVFGGDDSSKAGTVNVKDPSIDKKAEARKWDSERLYASVDEYFFRPDRTGRDEPVKQKQMGFYDSPPGSSTAQPRLIANYAADVANPTFTADNLEKLRFFLTAHSRAPELNAFGKPRIGIWPIHQELPKRSAFDDLAAFCSTVAGRGYYVLRKNPNSAIQDFVEIPQNQRLYAYMQNLTKTKLPFMGKSFISKYGPANRDQLLTDIFDYIRCTNLVDTGIFPKGSQPLPRSAPDTDPGTTPGEKMFPLAYTRYFWSEGPTKPEACAPAYGSGQVTPIRIDAKYNPESGADTKGFGRFVTLGELAICFYKEAGGGVAPTQMKAVMLLEMYMPSQSFPGISERYSVRVRPLIQANEQGFMVWDDPADQSGTPMPLKFPVDALNSVEVDAYNGPIGRVFLPLRGFANQFLIPKPGFDNGPKAFGPSPTNAPVRGNYPFYSETVTLSNPGKKFTFKGGTVEVTIYDRPATPGAQLKTEPLEALGPNRNPQIVQQFRLRFPDVKGSLPFPNGALKFPSRLASGAGGNRTTGFNYGTQDGGRSWIDALDVVRSIEVGGITRGDQRLAAANILVDDISQENEDKRFFTKREDDVKKFDSIANLVHGLRVSRGAPYQGHSKDGVLVKGPQWRNPPADSGNPKSSKVPYFQISDSGTHIAAPGVMRGPGADKPGDWDRGLSKNMSGAFINKADEGNTNFEPGRGSLGIPYFLGFSGFHEVGGSVFSPNRLMPSAGMFGSLPTRVGVFGGKPAPWETLLFRPQDAPGDHPGAEDPADHYLLDLFQMPVVEPYAISEPLSTAGKVNLNYQIAPFGYVKVGAKPYIERRTALYGLLKPVKMLCLDSSSNGVQWAGHGEDPTSETRKYRFDLDLAKTVDEMDKRIDKEGLFKTASEICEVQLIPDGKGAISNWQTFWKQYGITGDNGRERPYALIYPRATTKSNVFTVYVRSQSIKKSPNTKPDEFDEDKDHVTGEYRGSTTIERFLDPNDPAIAKYDPVRDNAGLDKYYRFRVVNTKRFSP